MIRVLISGAGGDVAQGTIKALWNSALDVQISAACVTADSSWLHAPNVSPILSPYVTDTQYIDWLQNVLITEEIDAYLPTVDEEIAILAPHADRLRAETRAAILCGKPEQVAICADKFETSSFLSQNGFAFPLTARFNHPDLDEVIEQIGYPLIVKPRDGRGSRDVQLVNNRHEIAPFLGRANMVAQQFLEPSEGEYTSGIYLGAGGKVKGVAHFLRRLKNGSTVWAERVISKEFDSQLIPIAEMLGLKYLNIQSMRSGDTLVPFEFNARLSGTTAMVAKAFNAPEMFLREHVLGQTLTRNETSEEFVALRYMEEIYTSRENIEAIARKVKN